MKTRILLLSIAFCGLVALTAMLSGQRAEQAEAAAAPAPKTVDTGQSHTCALTAGGGVKCWGANGYGQLGDGTSTSRTSPVTVCSSGAGATCPPLTGVVSISTGDYHTCAVLDDGSARCWGLNEGRLGDGDGSSYSMSLLPVPVCASGAGPACPQTQGILQISAGGSHTCAVIGVFPQGGAIRCWGLGDWGQLGHGGDYDVPTPVNVCSAGGCGAGSLFGMVEVSAGDLHTCGRLYDGRVLCWGQGTSGELGDGTYHSGHLIPGFVCNIGCSVNLTGVVEIEAGNAYSCALLDTGKAACWGLNASGQLGDGTTTDHLSPVEVCNTGSGPGCSGGAALTHAASLDAGHSQACVLVVSTEIRCWGVGYGDNPVEGTGASQKHFMSVSADLHNCAIDNTGKLYCWASNSSGQVGNGTSGNFLSAPVLVSGFAFTSSTAMTDTGNSLGATSCARRWNGTLKCWGPNDDGSVGDGTTAPRISPVNVCYSGMGSGCTPAGGFASVVSGGEHTCALTMYYPYGGSAQCWGENGLGQLGDNTVNDHLIPQFVCGAGSGATCSGGYVYSGWTTLVAGHAHTCGLVYDGTVRCWGRNADGQLGDNTLTDRHLPITVCGGDEFCSTSLAGVVAISGGNEHTCALLSNSNVKCWGDNQFGQLGDGTTSDRASPRLVCNTGVGVSCSGGAALFGVVAISAGEGHTCALLVGSNIVCWGANGGALGDGTATNRLNPAFMCETGAWNGSTCAGGVALRHAAEVDAGGGQTCLRSIEADADAGSVRCVGLNVHGQLGDGTTTSATHATYVCESGSGGACPKQLHAASLGVSDLHSCLLASDGSVRCWGYGNGGELGYGGVSNQSNPVTLGLSLVDIDGDGCSDSAEMDTTPGSQLACGFRDPKNPFDYFNPTGDGQNRIDDVLAVVGQYFDDDTDGNPGFPPYAPGYDPDTDRTDNPASSEDWDLLAGNGQQRIDDILAIIKQYFHDVS